MKLSPITKLVIAIGAVGVPYLMFMAPEGTSVASVSEHLEPLERVSPEALERPVYNDVIELPSAFQRIRPRDHYAAMVERPLFAISRRPDVEDTYIEPEVYEEPEQDNWVDDEFVRLVGTIRRGDEMKALISSSDYVELFTVGVGEQVSKWTLKELKTNEAVLDRDGEPLVLKLLD